METAVRPTTTSIKPVTQHWQGEFTELVKQLERKQMNVQFMLNTNPNFPLSETASVTTYQNTAVVTMNFMGLLGHHGVLPSYYQSVMNQALRQKQGGFAGFLSVFQHRLVQLQYRVWLHARPTLREKKSVDTMVSGFAGLLSPTTPSHHSLLKYAGLLRRRPLSRLAIESILSDYFDLPIRVSDFVASNLRLEDRDVTRLGRRHAASHLGVDMMLGKQVQQYQGQCLIQVGPLHRRQFYALLPNQSMAKALVEVAKFLIPAHKKMHIQLLLQGKSVPELKLSKSRPPQLGLTSWCRHRPLSRVANDVNYNVTKQKKVKSCQRSI